MLLYVIYSPFLALVIVSVLGPAYLVAFWLWARVCTRYPSLDRWRNILVIAGIVSVAPSIATAAYCARGPLGVPWDIFLTWLPFCLAMFWGAVVIPRWLVDSLRPGVFAHPTRRATQA